MNELTTSTSGNLTAEQQDAYRLDCEIKSEARNIMNGICRIGRCLKEMKDRRLYEQLGCSSLEEYAEQAVGLKGRAAYNYISAYETYGEQGLERYGQLGITKLSALAQLADSDREELLESGKAEELSTRELQEEIKRLKRQNDQLTFELEEMEEKKQAASVDMKELVNAQNEAADLKETIRNLQANAQKAPPSGNKELLKFLMQNIVADFNKAVELVKAFPAEEQDSCKAALKKVAEAIKTAGDNL